MAVKLQLRRDTASNWTSNNPTLSEGELGVETNTSKLKLGDGTTAWSSLAYVAGGTVTQDLVDSDYVTTRVTLIDGGVANTY